MMSRITTWALGVCLFAWVCAAQTTPSVLEQTQVVFDDLVAPIDSAVSPDGKHVYVAGSGIDFVVVYSRNQTTGELTSVGGAGTEVNAELELAGANAVVVSPDGNHVYVTAGNDKALVVFGRDKVSGTLTLVDVVRDGEDGVELLNGPSAVTISPNGGHVYVAASSVSTLLVFSRDDATGALTFVESQRQSENGVDGLSIVLSVKVSPDGKHLYAVARGSHSLAVFSRDEVAGTLTFVEAIRDGVDGVDGLNQASHVTVSPGGSHVYATGYGDGALAVFARNGTTGILEFVEVFRDNEGGVNGLWGASSVALSPDGNFVYASGSIDNAIVTFERDDMTGELSFVGFVSDDVVGVDESGIDGIAGVQALTMSPDGISLYAAGSSDGALAVFGRNSSTGSLGFVGDVREGPNGPSSVDGIAGVNSVALSPEGDFVYTAGSGEDAIVVFAREPGSGQLTFVAMERHGSDGVTGLDGAMGITVSPDGNHVYAAGHAGLGSGSLAVFSRDGGSGTVTFVEDSSDGVFTLEGATALAVSPDGKHVYVAADQDNTITAFGRNLISGELTFIQAQGNSANNGLAEANSVVVSPDGRHVYATGFLDDAVTVFSRDEGSGMITFVEVLRDGENGVDGLDGAIFVAVSPDGKNVYVAGAGPQDRTVAVFSRDSNTGVLTFVEMVRNGFEGIAGIDFVSSLAVSPDGTHLYVTSSSNVAVFSRTLDTGALTFIEVIYNSRSELGGLGDVESVAVSPDASHVYVASSGDSAVSVFRKRVVGFMSGFVVDEDSGTGLSCAALELASAGRVFVKTVVTDLNGFYFFTDVPVGTYSVRVLSPGLGEVSLDNIMLEEAQVLTQDFILPPGTETPDINGIVTDADTSEPLVGAFVEAFVSDALVDTTYTCASGAYEIFIPGLKGSIDVRLEFSLANYNPATQNVTVVPGEVTSVNQALEKTVTGIGSLSGFVFVESTKGGEIPVPNAQVTISGGNSYATTRADGSGEFSFDSLIDGTYTIRASALGYGGASDQRFLADGAALVTVLHLEDGSMSSPEDINSDGSINSIDIQLVINDVLGIGEAGIDGDVNSDGSVNSGDIQTVINSVLGLK